jgi:mitochondrial fission protein ELM1
MVSEAIAAGRPVELLDLGFRRHVGFVQSLVDAGLARRFVGDPAPPAASGPANATAIAAAAVRRLYLERGAQAWTGVVG